MKRLALAVVTVAAVAASASAQNLNCDRDFKTFWEKMSGPGAKDLTAKQLADTARVAVRGYDACTAGDERFNARDFFDKLATGSAKPEDIFKEIDRQGAGAKK
jgi:uncharacterized protein YdeI (BOF family)